MYNTFTDIRKLKQKGWANHNKVGSKNFKSVHDVLNYYKYPTDFEQIAINVSKNQGHEFYGYDPKEISEMWKKKGKVGIERGKNLDRFIQNKLHRVPFKNFKETLSDEILVKKYVHFDNLLKNVLIPSKFRPISCENWINSAEYKIRGKFDELFYIDGTFNGYVLVDWKNTEKIDAYSDQNMKGCLSHLPSATLYHNFLQIYIYTYLLREEYNMNIKSSRIIQIAEEGYDVLSPPKDFTYNKELIEQVIKDFNKSKNNE